MTDKVIKIGTRKSELAMAQSETVRQALLAKFPGRKFELFPVVTTGDERRDKLNLNVEDKKQWVIEIENLLLNKEIDLAVHSAKDVPINIEKGTSIQSILPREDSQDILILKTGVSLGDEKAFLGLPKGCAIGTSSKRRKAQILMLRPDIEVVPFRGNINRRVEKLAVDEKLSGIVLAAAGVNRLKLDAERIVPIGDLQMLSAVGQGQLLAQFLTADSEAEKMLSEISNVSDQHCYEAERKVIEVLGADCHSAVGVKARMLGDEITVECVVLNEAGTSFIRESVTGERSKRLKSAEFLANSLIEKGARTLLFA